jgi:putative FmdB family regulatory protein
MPIYAYRCSACNGSFEFLQKLSEGPMTECPTCKTATLAKQVTAAGFQLKGSGWYATDFKGGGSRPAASAGSDSGASAGDAKPAASGGGDSGSSGGESKAPASSTPAACS